MKIVIADVKSGHAFSREVPKDKESMLVGKKIGEKIEGGIIGLPTYTLQIAGGSDIAGFPMRPDVPGFKRTKAIIGAGAGIRHVRKGTKEKRRVSGNTISSSTQQINVKIAEYGSQALDALGFVYTPKTKEEKEKKA